MDQTWCHSLWLDQGTLWVGEPPTGHETYVGIFPQGPSMGCDLLSQEVTTGKRERTQESHTTGASGLSIFFYHSSWASQGEPVVFSSARACSIRRAVPPLSRWLAPARAFAAGGHSLAPQGREEGSLEHIPGVTTGKSVGARPRKRRDDTMAQGSPPVEHEPRCPAAPDVLQDVRDGKTQEHSRHAERGHRLPDARERARSLRPQVECVSPVLLTCILRAG